MQRQHKYKDYQVYFSLVKILCKDFVKNSRTTLDLRLSNDIFIFQSIKELYDVRRC